jgi:hypothetical protein
MSSELKTAIDNGLARDDLDTVDREFLLRWRKALGEDSAIWAAIEQQADHLVFAALDSRRVAIAAAKSGIDIHHEEATITYEKMRAALNAATCLIDYFHDPGPGFPLLGTSFEFKKQAITVKELIALHEIEANVFRKEMRPPQRHLYISQQTTGRKAHQSYVEHGVFMRSMTGYMRHLCGKPLYRTVAKLTNLAYPEAEASAEVVRAACKLQRRTKKGRGGVQMED